MTEVRETLITNLSRDEAIRSRRIFAAWLRTMGAKAKGCSVDLVPPKPGRRHGWCVELVRECPETPEQSGIRKGMVYERLAVLATLAAQSSEMASSLRKIPEYGQLNGRVYQARPPVHPP